MTPHYCLDARTVTPHFPGIGRYVRNLTLTLLEELEEGERLTILVENTSQAEWLAGSFRQKNPGFLATARASPFSLRQQWALPRQLEQLDASLYHSPYYLMPYAPGRPAILTVYDLIPMLFPERVSARARLFFHVAMRLALRAARHIIAISETTSRDLQVRFGLPAQRIRVIPLAAEAQFQPASREAIQAVRHRYQLPERYALYLGGDKPHKNLERLLQAWANLLTETATLPPVLVLAGLWSERKSNLQALASRLGLQESVRFLGPVTEPELPAVYSGAALFINPSLYEGFGLPVLEALACGTPVACSNTGTLVEVSGEAAAYFDPTSSNSISAAITSLLEDQPLRQRMVEAGLQRSRRFSWRQTARRTLEVYRSASGDYDSHSTMGG